MSFKNILLFLLFFALTYLATLKHFLNNNHTNYKFVLAAATTLPTTKPQPIPSPTLVPTPKPTMKPASTPEPTETPYVEPTPTPDVWSPPDIEPIMARFAGQYGVDKNILERLANCESHFNPNAVNGDYLGLFQFSARSWQYYRGKIGEDINPELRRDIEASIKTAAYVISTVGTSPWPRCLN